MKEKANYPNTTKKKIDHFLAFRRKAKSYLVGEEATLVSRQLPLLLKAVKIQPKELKCTCHK